MEIKRKWEKDYKNYTNSRELDERIDELMNLAKDKSTKVDENDKLKKLATIKKNLPKVKVILEFREQLKSQRKELGIQIKNKEHVIELKELEKILEKQMKKLEVEYANLGTKIKNSSLRVEEKADIKSKMEINEKARQENSAKFEKCLKEMNEYGEQEKFKKMTLDDMKNDYKKIAMNISKCNMACGKLMGGNSWESINILLDRYKTGKLTAVKESEVDVITKNICDEEVVSSEKVKNNDVMAQNTKQEKKEDMALEVPTRWIKIRGWTKNLFEKWFVEEIDEGEIEMKKEKKKSKSSKKKSIFTRLKKAYNAFMEKEENNN